MMPVARMWWNYRSGRWFGVVANSCFGIMELFTDEDRSKRALHELAQDHHRALLPVVWLHGRNPNKPGRIAYDAHNHP